MRVREMRELSTEELQTRIYETRKEIVELRFLHAARKLESTAKLRQARKKLARFLTIKSEKYRSKS